MGINRNRQLWDQFAAGMAAIARSRWSRAACGTVLLEIENADCPVAAIFGNEDYGADDRVQERVDGLREELESASLEEIGFGVSPNGEGWAILARPGDHYETRAGKAFQEDLLAIRLEETFCRFGLLAIEDSRVAVAPRKPSIS